MGFWDTLHNALSKQGLNDEQIEHVKQDVEQGANVADWGYPLPPRNPPPEPA